MYWANQPVIGYGLPEHTRERMDLLSSRGMVGYFGQKFYNLVYDLVSHEGIDPDQCIENARSIFEELELVWDLQRLDEATGRDPDRG